MHRDIKPSNLMCSFAVRPNAAPPGGRQKPQPQPQPAVPPLLVKLGDFGVARALSGDAACAHTLVGTPYYLAPELVQVSKHA